MKNFYLSRAALVALSMGLVSNVMAEDINVTDVASLVTAVNNAQNGDVIRIAAGNYLLDNELDVNGKTVSFIGSGTVVLDGQNKVRVMNVHANANATVENLIIQNGSVNDASNNKGAGIRVDGGSLTVKNCKFINNSVEGLENNWTGGAGIHGNNTTITISNSEFTGGSAYQGGAITLQNTNIDAKYCLFEGNKTVFAGGGKKDAAKGGAICVRTDNGDVHTHNFEYCVFKDNVSWGNGGGVSYNVSGGAAGQNTTFRGCSFIGNTTNIDVNNIQRTNDNDGLRGGAAFIDTDGRLKIYFLSCTIAQNYSATGGGGVAIPTLKSKPEAEARFINCTVTENHNLDNSGNGAGMWINDNSNSGGIAIVNSIITGNWSIKVKDETYATDVEAGENWKHWEYSDLITTGSTKQDLFTISNSVIGYLNNGDKYTGEYPNLVIRHQESQAWVEGETEKDQLGELDSYNKDYFAYPFSISAQDWLDGDLGDMASAENVYDCATDQFGAKWEVKCIGSVQTDNLEDNVDVPVFFDQEYVPTGINTIGNGVVKTAGNACYTVDGIRVAAPVQKGLYILNGKKVVVK